MKAGFPWVATLKSLSSRLPPRVWFHLLSQLCLHLHFIWLPALGMGYSSARTRHAQPCYSLLEKCKNASENTGCLTLQKEDFSIQVCSIKVKQGKALRRGKVLPKIKKCEK